MGKRAWRRAIAALGGMLVLTGIAFAQAGGGLAALSRLEPGRWEVRELDNPRAVPRSLCLSSPGELIQLQHRGLPCSRLVIANEADRATVHYTCPQGGFGRTTVRVVTRRVAVVDSQGIHNGRPFEFRAEARRMGGCRRR